LSDLSAQTGQTSSAVLQMAGNGVTHVIDFDDNGTIGLTFMNNAESQGYRPRYGVTSGSEANYLVTSGTVPAAQFGGAAGIGWSSLLDVPVNDWLDGANATRRHCAAVLAKAGFKPQPGFDQVGAAAQCDALNVLTAAIAAAGAAPSQASFARALNTIRAGYQSASTPGTYLTSERRDAVSSSRAWAFSPACRCMSYTSGTQAL
jgi:hypothetical protein